MFKRIVAAPLWLIAVWCLYDLAAYFTGLPRVVGPVLGTALAAFVVVDPLGLFWAAPVPRSPKSPASATPGRPVSPAARELG